MQGDTITYDTKKQADNGSSGNGVHDINHGIVTGTSEQGRLRHKEDTANRLYEAVKADITQNGSHDLMAPESLSQCDGTIDREDTADHPDRIADNGGHKQSGYGKFCGTYHFRHIVQKGSQKEIRFIEEHGQQGKEQYDNADQDNDLRDDQTEAVYQQFGEHKLTLGDRQCVHQVAFVGIEIFIKADPHINGHGKGCTDYGHIVQYEDKRRNKADTLSVSAIQ